MSSGNFNYSAEVSNDFVFKRRNGIKVFVISFYNILVVLFDVTTVI